RRDLAAVRDQRVEARQLERGHEQVLLADRELDGVARLPEPVDLPVAGIALLRVARVPPRDRRQQAGRLRPEVDSGRAAEPEARGPLLERLLALGRQLPEVVPELVEVGVAGA